MATLDAEDLAAIRVIIQEELSAMGLPTLIETVLNANAYIQRLDQNVSAASGLTVDEHNHLMGLTNTSVEETTRAAKTMIALAGERRTRKK